MVSLGKTYKNALFEDKTNNRTGSKLTNLVGKINALRFADDTIITSTTLRPTLGDFIDPDRFIDVVGD